MSAAEIKLVTACTAVEGLGVETATGNELCLKTYSAVTGQIEEPGCQVAAQSFDARYLRICANGSRETLRFIE